MKLPTYPPPPYRHQINTSAQIMRGPSCFVASDPGTGKTRSVLLAFEQTVNCCMVVFCPKSIMLPAWGSDIDKFAPKLLWSIAKAPTANRLKAFHPEVDIVIINHDAAKWLNQNIKVLTEWIGERESWLCIDESTAFKNPTSQRTKAMVALADVFNKRIAMSGFPTPNHAMEMWSQVRIIDGGQRMGRNYYQTRVRIQKPVQQGQFVNWVDQDDAQEKIFNAISDICVRYKLEEVLDMPEHINRTLNVDTSTKFNNMYMDLANEAYIALSDGEISAVNKAVLVNKLLQMCSGAAYNDEGEYSLIHPERYELIMDLVGERQQSLVAFLWKHQHTELTRLADSLHIRHCSITSDMSPEERNRVVEQFQAGLFQVLFAHPQSAGHGLTLTKARSVIWSSPTWSSEQYVQFNRRIYRAGQNNRTEVINIAANGTVEAGVYDKLTGKIDQSTDLLELFENLQTARAA